MKERDHSEELGVDGCLKYLLKTEDRARRINLSD